MPKIDTRFSVRYQRTALLQLVRRGPQPTYVRGGLEGALRSAVEGEGQTGFSSTCSSGRKTAIESLRVTRPPSTTTPMTPAFKALTPPCERTVTIGRRPLRNLSIWLHGARNPVTRTTAPDATRVQRR